MFESKAILQVQYLVLRSLVCLSFYLSSVPTCKSILLEQSLLSMYINISARVCNAVCEHYLQYIPEHNYLNFNL